MSGMVSALLVQALATVAFGIVAFSGPPNPGVLRRIVLALLLAVIVVSGGVVAVLS